MSLEAIRLGDYISKDRRLKNSLSGDSYPSIRENSLAILLSFILILELTPWWKLLFSDKTRTSAHGSYWEAWAITVCSMSTKT